MSVTNSPNMGLPIPAVGNESGPDYAFDVNASLTLVDGHDHSPGRGVQVTPAGLNINAALSFQNNSQTNVGAIQFQAQASNVVLQTLYVAPGTETPPINDLWFNDGNGTAVQITSGGEVNATIASLPGENYAAGTFFWKQGAGSVTPANFDIGSIVLRPNTAATAFGVQLSPPAGISSQYNFVLPILPGASSFLAIDSVGNVTATIPTSGGITTSNISPTANIVGTQLSASADILGSQLDPGANIVAGQIASVNPTAVLGSDSVITLGTVSAGSIAPSGGTVTIFTAGAGVLVGNIKPPQSGAAVAYMLIFTPSGTNTFVTGNGFIINASSGNSLPSVFNNSGPSNSPNFTLVCNQSNIVGGFTILIQARNISGSTAFTWPAMTIYLVQL